MQLTSKPRGQVSWSGHPLDDQLSVLEVLARASTHGLAADPGLSSDTLPPNSDFMPYIDSGMSGDVDLLPTMDRALRQPTATASPTARRQQHPARPASPASAASPSGRSDPQALRSAWTSWLATHPVANGHARAAASMRVREVDLLRALEGHGVHALHTDLAALLAPVTQWGRLLAEVHHPLGVAYLGLAPRQLRNDAGQVALIEPDRQLLLAGQAFAECFLVHGAGACGLHGFDERGEPVARLHLVVNPSGAHSHSAAMQHLLAHAATPDPQLQAQGAGQASRLVRPGWCAIERQVHAPDALAELCRLVNTTLDAGPTMQFALENESVILACQATALHKAGAHPPSPQAQRDCRLHLRSTAVRHATICTGSDGRPFVRLHALHGSCLRFQLGGNPAEARAWVDSLLQRQA